MLISIACCKSDDNGEAVESTIFEGDVRLITQEDVDEFGANNYTAVTGTLEIGRQFFEPSMTNLNASSSLTSVSEFHVVETPLTDLFGLDNLMEVNIIYIFNNESLKTLTS